MPAHVEPWSSVTEERAGCAAVRVAAPGDGVPQLLRPQDIGPDVDPEPHCQHWIRIRGRGLHACPRNDDAYLGQRRGVRDGALQGLARPGVEAAEARLPPEVHAGHHAEGLLGCAFGVPSSGAAALQGLGVVQVL